MTSDYVTMSIKLCPVVMSTLLCVILLAVGWVVLKC